MQQFLSLIIKSNSTEVQPVHVCGFHHDPCCRPVEGRSLKPRMSATVVRALYASFHQASRSLYSFWCRVAPFLTFDPHSGVCRVLWSAVRLQQTRWDVDIAPTLSTLSGTRRGRKFERGSSIRRSRQQATRGNDSSCRHR